MRALGFSFALLFLATATSCGGTDGARTPADSQETEPDKPKPLPPLPPLNPDLVARVPRQQTGCTEERPTECVRIARNLTRSGAAADLDKAREAFAVACAAKHATGCFELGELHRTAAGPLQDTAKAADAYGSACEAGHAAACFRAAGWLWNGAVGVEADASRARDLAEKGCQEKNWPACDLVTAGLLRGHGVDKDEKKAKSLLTDACTGGHGRACTALGLMHSLGRGTTKAPKEAAAAWKKACDLEHGQACALLAWAHERGKGVKVDFPAAGKLREQACGLGYCPDGKKVTPKGKPAPAEKVIRGEKGESRIGSFTASPSIKASVNRLRARFQYCYERELKKSPEIEGVVTLQVDLNAAGRVNSIYVNRTGQLPKPVLDCMRQAVHRARFEPPEGGKASFNLPVIFRPREDDAGKTPKATGASAQGRPTKPKNTNALFRPYSLDCSCSPTELEPICALECPAK